VASVGFVVVVVVVVAVSGFVAVGFTGESIAFT